MSLRHAIEVKPLSDHTLWIRFDDQSEGEVDLAHLAGKGVFKIWKTPGMFESVFIGDDGSLRWGADVDLCADALYERTTHHSRVDVIKHPQGSTASIDELRETIDAAFGACADDAEDLDEFDRITRHLRHMDRREVDG